MSGPQVELTGGAVVVVVGLLVGGLLVWKASQAASSAAGAAWAGVKDGAATVGGWVNPVSDQNLAYRGVNAVGGAVAGDDDWTLGGWIYDITHDDPMATPPFTGGATGSW